MADSGDETSWYFDAAATGVMAYVIGYVITYLLKGDVVSRAIADPQGLIGSGSLGQPSKWQMVAWLYAGMHNVPGVVRLRGGGRSMTQELHWSETGPVWESWLLLVPVVLLVLAGFGYADDFLDPDAGPLDGAKMGAVVVLGYFPAALLGAGATQWRTSVSGFAGSVEMEIGAKIAESALVAGLAYPIIFGAVGGLLAARETGGSDDRPPDVEG